MAKTKKAAKRTSARTTPKKTTAKRTTTRRASSTSGRAKRAPTRRAGGMRGGGLFDFTPPAWIKDVMSSQTSRVIMAEALVAAAGAAAAVLVASRTESGRRAEQALADGGALMKEAAISAAVAARDVISRGASDALGSAARSLMGATEETQHQLSDKALRMKREHGEDMEHDMAEEARRHRERQRPH